MSTETRPPGSLATRAGGSAAALWMLDDQVVHLNHGSYGAAPRATVEHRSRLLADVDANPLAWHTGLAPRYDEARAVVARYLGAGAGALAFVPTASAGTTAAIRALLRDEVVITDHAYGALALHVRREAAWAGAAVVTAHVPLAADADEALAAILDAVTSRTRLIVLDQVTSATARELPVDAVVAAAHERGIAVVVDAAHAPGMLEHPVVAHADAWVGNLHKWACGVRGTAAVVLGAAAARRVRPPIESWGGDDYPASFDVQGSADATSYLASAAGLEYIEAQIGWDRIRVFQRELVRYGRDLIADAFAEITGDDHGVDVGMPAPSMALVALPGSLATSPEAAGALRQRIADELGFETQIAGWGGVARLRLSAHAYSTPADFEAFAERAVPVLTGWART